MPCRKARGRNASKYTEEMEDADLLKDGMEVQGHRLSQQPAVIKHGIMRDYQMQGLNWLIHLYDNGINGILADEMVSILPCAWAIACKPSQAASLLPLQCRTVMSTAMLSVLRAV